MRISLLMDDGESVLLHHVPFPSEMVFYGPLLTVFARPHALNERMVTRVGPFVEDKYPVLKRV